MPDARVGLVLDKRYRIDEWIAAGGTGVVYRGTRVGLAKSVAIKFLHQSGSESPRRLKRFQREAEAMSRLTHPNLATVIDFGSHDGVPYLVMEFYEGRSLRKTLEAGPLGPARAISITRQILAGMASAHEAGVVHRDLKPANVLLELSLGTDYVKILDFGVAKLVGNNGGLTEVSVTSGEPQGTPQYMAPEQARGKPVSPRTDLYAVGIILYEMVTGQRPFDKGVGFAVLRQQIEDEPVPPRELKPSLSGELEAVILRAMAKEPERRFESAALMASALAVVPEAQKQQKSRAPSQRQQGSRLRIAVLLLLLFGAATFSSWYAAENGLIEVPEWLPWQSSEPTPAPTVATTPIDAGQVVAKDAASIDSAPAWNPEPAEVVVGQPPPSEAPSFAIRGRIAGKRFAPRFARFEVSADAAVLSLAETPPAGDLCEDPVPEALELRVPARELEAKRTATGTKLAVMNVPKEITARYSVRATELDAATGVAKFAVKIRGRRTRLRGDVNALYCLAPSELPGPHSVSGVAWSLENVPSPAALPDIRVAGVIGGVVFTPRRVLLTQPDDERLALMFSELESESPCQRDDSALVVSFAAAMKDDGQTIRTGARLRTGSVEADARISLLLEPAGAEIRGRLYVAANQRQRGLVVGGFVAEDCRTEEL